MMLRYEFKKVLSKRVNRILMAAIVILALAFSCFAVGSFRFVDVSGNVHTGISVPRVLVAERNQWQGELTADKLSQVAEKYRAGDWQSTYDIVYSGGRMLAGEHSDYDDYVKAFEVASEAQLTSIYDKYRENLKYASEDEGETPEQIAFLMKQYEKIDTPFYYEAADSWDTMYLYGTTFSIILIVVIGFMAAGILAEEFQYKADAVFFSVKYGRSRAVGNKIKAGLITATIVYWGGVGLLSLICFAIMGVSGANTPYHFYYPYAIYAVSCAQMYGLILLCGYVGALLSAVVSMLVAAKTRSVSIAVCVPFILFCVSPFIGRGLPVNKKFFALIPDQLVNVMNCARIPCIYQIGDLVFRQIPFITGFYAILVVAMMLLTYRNYRRLFLR